MSREYVQRKNEQFLFMTKMATGVTKRTIFVETFLFQLLLYSQFASIIIQSRKQYYIMYFNYVTNKAPILVLDSRGNENYNFRWHFLLSLNCITSLSNLYQGVEKKSSKEIHQFFMFYPLYMWLRDGGHENKNVLSPSTDSTYLRSPMAISHISDLINIHGAYQNIYFA